MVVSNNLLTNSFSFARIFQQQNIWTIFSDIVSSQPDGNECVAVLNMINETDPTCIHLFYLFSQIADFVLETYLTCGVRLGYVRLMIPVIRQMFSWIVTKKLEKRIQYLLRMDISLFTRGFFVLLQGRSQTQAFAVKLRKTLQGKRGAFVSNISQVGEPAYSL